MMLDSLGLRLENQKLWLLDQQRLPFEEHWFEVQNVDQMIQAIKALKVRGAPLIGIAAALILGLSARRGTTKEKLILESRALEDARPTAVNLRLAVEKLRSKFEAGAESTWEEALRLFDEDVRLCEAMADCGEGEFQDGDNILTHCNTGGLATVGIGTALGVLRRVWQSGKKIHVYVDETRPLLQGARLTVWELAKLEIPHTLISDNMAASLMYKKLVQKVILGSDRIAANGDFANKIGTYGVAVLAHHHRLPFYVAAPWTTVDRHCPSGQHIPIEERSGEEVRGFLGRSSSSDEVALTSWTLKQTPVYNPSFDVTPAELVTGWITDRGLFKAEDVAHGIFQKE